MIDVVPQGQEEAFLVVGANTLGQLALAGGEGDAFDLALGQHLFSAVDELHGRPLEKRAVVVHRDLAGSGALRLVEKELAAPDFTFVQDLSPSGLGTPWDAPAP